MMNISSSFAPSLARRETAKSGLGYDSHMPPAAPALSGGGGSFGPQSATSIYQQIHDMAVKRIATLEYLRKAYVM